MYRAIVARFPDRELDILRRAARDAEFKTICMDYEDVAAARIHWQADDRRLRDYADLAAELEAEVLALLVPAAGDRP